ncbi:integrase catalytic domain-containing protein [Trichonephila clavata]|uniref:Integrase catalytic domain-containing protein n=1 Tax=Trichonephila clavata TaxID=2740835 RepID=A0A8X6LY68_TRICU|nr:integrase catalytic domain-containing protein [Trichonephila clavata]
MDKNCLIQRKVLRSAVTKTISELDNCIAANDFHAASLAFTKLEEKTKRLFENDELVITYLSSHPDPDTDPDTIVENELEQNETYRDNFISAKVRFQEFSKIYEQKTQQLDISPSMDRLSINLPKLQLIDFDGNPKNWFSFWSMFQKIDEDPKIEDDVKFAYLMQTTKGKALDFVQSYHVSKGEYKTVIKNLKTRFADDKMLIELYVRELLKLILNQSHNMSFTDLVDQLDTYLRCLENLGVTKEKYACMLYPLVEASIPEQILIAWERERNSISRNSTANTHDLDLLIQFLRSEVVSAERLRIAKAFCAGEKDKNKTSRQKTDPSRDLSSVTPVPTASSFVTQTKSETRESNIFCLFCSKKTHRSSDCFTAQKMPFQDRKEKVLKMKACLSCLRINCRADRCGMSVRCIVCSKKHFPILCPNLCRENENSFSSPSKTEINSVTSNSSSGSTDVLLQTLRIRVSGPLKTKIVRCLCDSASQRSYINRDLAEFLDLKVDHPEFLKHSLFGGIETEKIKHFAFKCELQEIRGNFSCEAILLDKEVICGTIPKIIDESTTTLHMFSDASGKAFAACVFLRIECDNKVKIKLVQAKSRVAPLKKDPITKTKNEMSIPKLELLAAVIGTRLVQSVKTSLNIHSIQTFYWTDSKVVLCWIKNSGTWKTFVRNRIKEIHSSSSKEDWYYVPSQMNAADIASRGCNAQTLFSLCWWEGPIWLKNRSSWPDTKDSDFKDALELATEVRKPTVTTNLSLNDSDSNFFEWTKRVSKFSSIVRTLAYVKRFLSNAKSVANRQKDCLLKGNLSEKELSKSELEILLFIQKETFGKNRRLIPPNFVVYLDSDGLLRVETKLFSTDTGDYFRRPILLPDKQELVLRLIEETHRIHNHALVIVLRGLGPDDMQNLRKRAKHLHAVKHKLKTRFQKEYISLLKQTSNKVQTPLSVGDIVLISLDNKKRVDWPLAKIVEIYKGRDGVSRVARLKTQSGELIRPIQRLCRLETSGKIAEIMREPITTRRGLRGVRVSLNTKCETIFLDVYSALIKAQQTTCLLESPTGGGKARGARQPLGGSMNSLRRPNGSRWGVSPPPPLKASF